MDTPVKQVIVLFFGFNPWLFLKHVFQRTFCLFDYSLLLWPQVTNWRQQGERGEMELSLMYGPSAALLFPVIGYGDPIAAHTENRYY